MLNVTVPTCSLFACPGDEVEARSEVIAGTRVNDTGERARLAELADDGHRQPAPWHAPQRTTAFARCRWESRRAGFGQGPGVLLVAFLFLVAVGGVRDEAIVGGELDQLLRSDENTRADWLDRHRQPTPEANCWLHLLQLINERWARRPAQRPAWTQLKIWLLGQASERSALGESEVAERMAYYVSQMLLRALITNGDLDTYSTYHIQQEHRRNHTSPALEHRRHCAQWARLSPTVCKVRFFTGC